MNTLIGLSVFLFLAGVSGFRVPNFDANVTNLWAVLVAGSDGWENYRHQADICHAYQILHNHGIPDERIIVLMKDDLAQNPANPTKGIIINHPKGKDVYKGVPHDYTGENVTPENFMAVLRGDKKALEGKGSGKVLKSNANDHVFVYFSDHGAPGLIAFPSSELTAKNLSNTIHYMHEKKMYKKMVIYVEACESGSMFENLLPKNISVYATTAANAEESSYACYFDGTRETYLGDLYSVNWMEDSDKENLVQETLEKQFKIVKKETTMSEVEQFGDMSIAKMVVGEFQGKKKRVAAIHNPRPKNMHTVRSRDVSIEILKKKYLVTESDNERVELLQKIAKKFSNRQFMADKVDKILNEIYHDRTMAEHAVEKRLKLGDYECYDELRNYFNNNCFNLSTNPYALDFLYILVNLCEKKVAIEQAKAAMLRACDHPPVHGID